MHRVMVSNKDKAPYPAFVDPDERDDEGWVNPHFDLDTVRDLAANTQAAAEKLGHFAVNTVHVVDGDPDDEPPALVIVVNWLEAGYKGAAEAVTIVEPIRHREGDDQDDAPDAGERLWPVGGFAWRWFVTGPDHIHPQPPHRPEQ